VGSLPACWYGALRLKTVKVSSRKKIMLLGLVLEIAILGAVVRWSGGSRSATVRPEDGAEVRPEDVAAATLPPRMDGTHPCVFASISGGSMTTGLGRCATPTEHSGSVDRFETDLRYGAFVLRQSDLRLNDVFDVPLTRSYSTNDWIPANRVHAFGMFSNHPYDVSPVGTRRPYTYMMLVLEDGDYLYFKRISKGGGFADAVYMHTETSTRYYKAIIHWNGDGWTLRLADGEETRFPEAYNAKSTVQGAAYEVKNAAGDVLTLHRDAARNLQEIRTPHNHWIRLQYDDEARIKRAEDNAGTWVEYGYNGEMLTSVLDSSGAGRQYEYEGLLMTAVRDEHGRTLVRNGYASGILVGQVFGNGDSYRYDYKTYPDGVKVTFPDHSERKITLENSIPDSAYAQDSAQKSVFLDILDHLTWAAFWVLVLAGLLGLTVRSIRRTCGAALYIASFIFGADVWLWSVGIVHSWWGTVAVIVGLVPTGVGIVPMAFAALALQSKWMLFRATLIDLVMMFVCLRAGAALIRRGD
jgi:YD repeat-containing protein